MEQVTLGITAQSYFRVHIDNRVYDLDVGSGHPNGAAAIKGSFVQRLKSYVIWVQTGVIQVGFYLFLRFSQYERTRETGPINQQRPIRQNMTIINIKTNLHYMPEKKVY